MQHSASGLGTGEPGTSQSAIRQALYTAIQQEFAEFYRWARSHLRLVMGQTCCPTILHPSQLFLHGPPLSSQCSAASYTLDYTRFGPGKVAGWPASCLMPGSLGCRLMAVLELQASHQQPEAPLPVQQAPAKGGRLTLRRLAVWLAQPMLQMRWLAAMVDSTAEQQGGALVSMPKSLSEGYLKAAFLNVLIQTFGGCLQNRRAALLSVSEPFA